MAAEHETDDVTIGEARPEDADRIADLFFADMVDLGLRPRQTELLAVAREMLANRSGFTHLRVARNGEGLVVGLVLANEFLSIKFPGRALWIEELYVAPGWRRGGLGKRLVESMLEWAHSAGISGVELEAYRMNTAASILYRSLGFRRLARERYSFDMAEYGAGEAADD